MTRVMYYTDVQQNVQGNSEKHPLRTNIKKLQDLCELNQAKDFDHKCVCPYCGSLMENSPFEPSPIVICPKCFCSLERTEQNLDTTHICPNCNHLLNNDNECNRCGYSMGSDFD